MKRMTVPFFLLLLLFVICKKEVNLKNLQVKAGDQIGIWTVDEDAMKDEIGCNPVNRMGLSMYKNMILTFTQNKLTVKLTILGKTKDFSGNYKIVSLKDNTIQVKATSGSQKGQVSSIEFLSKDSIRFAKEGDDDTPPLILKRQN